MKTCCNVFGRITNIIVTFTLNIGNKKNKHYALWFFVLEIAQSKNDQNNVKNVQLSRDLHSQMGTPSATSVPMENYTCIIIFYWLFLCVLHSLPILELMCWVCTFQNLNRDSSARVLNLICMEFSVSQHCSQHSCCQPAIIFHFTTIQTVIVSNIFFFNDALKYSTHVRPTADASRHVTNKNAKNIVHDLRSMGNWSRCFINTRPHLESVRSYAIAFSIWYDFKVSRTFLHSKDQRSSITLFVRQSSEVFLTALIASFFSSIVTKIKLLPRTHNKTSHL